MRSVNHMVLRGLAIALGGLLASSTASALPVVVFSATGDRGIFNIVDTVDWGGPPNALVLSKDKFPSKKGLVEVTVFRQGSPIKADCDGDGNPCDFQKKEQFKLPQPGAWTGNFENGAHVLDNLTFDDPDVLDDSIHIQFSELVMGAAAQIQLINTAPFSGRVRAYATPFVDGPPGPGVDPTTQDQTDDDFLVEFIRAGLSCDSNVDPTDGCIPGQAIFLGVSDTIKSIRRISFGILDESGEEAVGGINRLAVGILRSAAAVPEPGTLMLLTSSLLVLACGSRRFPRR